MLWCWVSIFNFLNVVFVVSRGIVAVVVATTGSVLLFVIVDVAAACVITAVVVIASVGVSGTAFTPIFVVVVAAVDVVAVV